MDGFKLVVEGHDRRHSFVCERCTPGNEELEIRSELRRLKRKTLNRQAGSCVSCNGTGHQFVDGRATVRPCRECGGCGFCPECNGQFERTWVELPLDAQQRFLSKVAMGDIEAMGGDTLKVLYPY